MLCLLFTWCLQYGRLLHFPLHSFLVGSNCLIAHSALCLYVTVSNTGNCLFLKVYGAFFSIFIRRGWAWDKMPSLSTLPNKLWSSPPWAQVQGSKIAASVQVLSAPSSKLGNWCICPAKDSQTMPLFPGSHSPWYAASEVLSGLVQYLRVHEPSLQPGEKDISAGVHSVLGFGTWLRWPQSLLYLSYSSAWYILNLFASLKVVLTPTCFLQLGNWKVCERETCVWTFPVTELTDVVLVP